MRANVAFHHYIIRVALICLCANVGFQQHIVTASFSLYWAPLLAETGLLTLQSLTAFKFHTLSREVIKDTMK